MNLFDCDLSIVFIRCNGYFFVGMCLMPWIYFRVIAIDFLKSFEITIGLANCRQHLDLLECRHFTNCQLLAFSFKLEDNVYDTASKHLRELRLIRIKNVVSSDGVSLKWIKSLLNDTWGVSTPYVARYIFSSVDWGSGHLCHLIDSGFYLPKKNHVFYFRSIMCLLLW